MGILKIPRITEAERTTVGFIPEVGELLYVTTNKKIYKGDGTTAGGIEVAGGTGGGIEYTTTTGTANTYVATITGISSYVEGDIYAIKFNATNTEGSTLQINSLTPAKTIVKNVNTALEAGDILANKIYILVYDGTNFQLVTLGGGGATGVAGGDLSGTYPNPIVDGLQGRPVLDTSPSTGQILQWNGSVWIPGAIPNGGSGGGGVIYYFNYGTTTNISPTAGLPTTPVAPSQLGVTYSIGAGSITSANLINGSYTLVCGFVTIVGTPGVTTIPAGLWDFNIWAQVIGANGSANQTQFQVRVYKYNVSTTPTLLASSDDIFIYDPTVIAQYIGNVTMPQTTILVTDRIYVEFWAQKSVNQPRQVDFYFDSLRPSHIHTTLPSVSGTGLVKVVNSVYQSPASTLVNNDVDPDAAIVVTKLAGGTANQVLRMSTGGSPTIGWGAIDLSSTAAVTNILPSTNGGTGSGFTKFIGPATNEKTFTLPNANATILTSNAAVTVEQGGTGYTSYDVGDILYANSLTSFNKLNAVGVGSVLVTNGTDANPTFPSWSNSPILRSIRLDSLNNSNNTVTIQTANPTSISYVLTLPAAAATGAQYLQTTGAGGTFQWTNGTVTGVTTPQTIGSAPNFNGMTITGSTLTLQPASSAFGGVVINGAQEFGGVKTFTSPSISTSLTTTTPAFTLLAASNNLTIGGTSTSTSTLNLFTNTTLSGQTKTINIGTLGASGSINNINIGSAVTGSTGLISLNENAVITAQAISGSPSLSINPTGGGNVDFAQLSIAGAGGGWMTFGAATGNLAIPSIITRSVGTRIVLYQSTNITSNLDYSIGVVSSPSGAIWFSSPANYLWYSQVSTGGAVSQVASLSNGGVLDLSVSTGRLRINNAQVVGTRILNWAAATGTATRTAFATDTVSTLELARRVKALIDDLITHGLIGT